MKHTHITTLVLSLFANHAIYAQDLPPQSNALVEKLETWETERRNEFSREITEKRKQVILILKTHLDQETKNGNLDGAIKIREKIESIQKEIKENPGLRESEASSDSPAPDMDNKQIEKPQKAKADADRRVTDLNDVEFTELRIPTVGKIYLTTAKLTLEQAVELEKEGEYEIYEPEQAREVHDLGVQFLEDRLGLTPDSSGYTIIGFYMPHDGKEWRRRDGNPLRGSRKDIEELDNHMSKGASGVPSSTVAMQITPQRTKYFIQQGWDSYIYRLFRKQAQENQ